MSANGGFGVYVHWPYCARVCPYCDFNVVRERGREAEKAALVQAILADLRAHAALTGPRTLTSVFLGGGTPSLMSPEAVAAIVAAASRLWSPAPDLEVTLEANPADLDRFEAFAEAGVNRLSLGVQAFDDDALRFLGRDHDAATARRAVAAAAQTFSRVSLDVIYALPGQSEEAWKGALTAIAALPCEHISPYQLSIEPGAAFARSVRRGAITPMEDDPQADLYQITQDVLGEAGFDAYEVSNHARGEAARSRHNLIYWRGGDYVGVGPGAHGRLTLPAGRVASLSPRSVRDYTQRVEREGLGSTHEPLDPREAAVERLLMGLRTVEGAPLAALSPLGITNGRIEALDGFVTVDSDRIRATPRGRLVLDRVAAELAA